MGQKKYFFTTDELEECFKAEKQVVLYGAGDYGKRIADYLFSVNKGKQIAGFVVTEKKETDNEYKGILIQEAEQLSHTGCFVIIAMSVPYQADAVKVVQKYGNRFCCMTHELYDEIGGELYPDTRKRMPYRGLDFMLAGFSKCGTTSLHRAMMQIEDIYLSKRKESAFFRWCDKVDKPMEKLAAGYFDNIREGQLVGMIEPDFSIHAEGIQRFFGRQLKLIFCVRNPVDAVYSRFKMNTRLGFLEMKEAYRQNGGAFSSGIFDLYFNQNERDTTFVKLGKYADWIEQFLAYYSKGQIKIVLFEDMVKDPRGIMNDILAFLGSNCQYEQESLPKENEGNFVMADSKGLEIAGKRLDMYWEDKYPDEMRKLSRDELYGEQVRLEILFNQAEKIYDVRMTGEQKQFLEKYYYDSVRRLEKIMDRDLSEIWF